MLAAALTTHAATDDKAQAFWPAMTADEMVTEPKPDVGTLPAVRQADVDLASGSATLHYPLLKWTVGAHTVSIGLSYSVRAYHTDELAGNIGLGWTLEGAGAVSRSIVGRPDEEVTFDMRRPENVDADYFKALTEYRTDASLDRYSYQCAAGSGQFVVHPGGRIEELPRSGNIIELVGDKREGVRDFRITAPDGTRYEFSEREHIEYRYLPQNLPAGFIPSDYNAVSTWLLSRVITPEGADTIKYEYATAPAWQRSHNRPTQTISVREDPRADDQITWLGQGISDESVNVNNTTFTDPRVLSRVSSRTGTAVFTTESPTKFSCFISGITLRDNNGETVRRVTLKGAGSVERRKLTGIRITDAGGELIDCNDFTYHSDNAHRYGDVFGYPNAPSNQPYDIVTVFRPETVKFNPRRRPDFAYATAGALKQTMSATGVVTEFTYEPNTISYRRTMRRASIRPGGIQIDTTTIRLPEPAPDPIEPNPQPEQPEQPEQPDSTLTIGIRLKSITLTDRITNRKQCREFTYSEGMCNMDLSRLSISDFLSISGLKWFYMPNPSGSILTITVFDTSSTLLYGSRAAGAAPESARIFYGRVTESVSGTGIDRPVLTEYEFDTSRCRTQWVAGGHDMVNGMEWTEDERTLNRGRYPMSTLPYKDLFGSHIVRGYFREHIGADPELHAVTSFRNDSGTYGPSVREERFYTTSDSVCILSGLHYEPLVRQIKHLITKEIITDFQKADDMSCFNTSVEATMRLLDSVAVTQYFRDGSQRVRTIRKHYAGQRFTIPGGSHGPLIPLDLLDSVPYVKEPTPWNTDSISMHANILLPVGETIREGGHTLEQHTAYSAMTSSAFYNAARSRGLNTLPVAQMWVMDRCDTLMRHFDYGRFGNAGLTRATSVVTRLMHGNGIAATVHEQSIGSYSPHGHPLRIMRTGQPDMICEWGYGGDMLTAIELAGRTGAAGLRTEYDWEELVGCSAIRSPSGRSATYSYKGGRLWQVTGSHGQTVAEYDYEMHPDTPGQFGGNNRISATAWLLDTNESSVTTTIYDGFTQPVATLAEGRGGSQEDVAEVTRYDALGRPVARWMPMALGSDLLKDSGNALRSDGPLAAAAAGHFGDEEAVSRLSYPGSAEDMPSAVTAGGTAFAGHPALSERSCSNPADPERRVRRWRWNGGTLSADGFYGAGELDAVRSDDGDGRVSWTFTDCLGRTVLRRQLTDEPGDYADTYTVSDPWGNPLIVLPPEAVVRLAGAGDALPAATAVTDILDRYAYIYTYDSRLRMRSKKLPGCEAIMYAYDSANRLVFTRDGNQARQGRRSFILYDALSRVAVTGTCRDALTESFWEADTPELAPATVTPCMIGGLSGASLTSLRTIGYEAAADPGGMIAEILTEGQLLLATYYDDYGFMPSFMAGTPGFGRQAPPKTAPRGLATGTLAAVLGTEGVADTIAPLLSVNYYDSEDRLTATFSTTTAPETTAASITEYTRGGLPANVTAALTNRNGETVTLETSTLFDRHGRPTACDATFSGATTFNLGRYVYDAMGRTAFVNCQRNMKWAYNYDMHGWRTRWRTPMMEQQLMYASGANPSYSGRISAIVTRDRMKSARYDYTYNRMGRLTAARYSGTADDPAAEAADFSTAYTYDRQGNILSLTRKGLTAPGIYGTVDEITATFSGNQTASLRDDAPTVLLESSLDLPHGQWDGTDFAYDANGNLCRDLSRGVTDITYNVLNLPQRVEFESGGHIDYLYSATGTKLRETVCDHRGDTLALRDYIAIFEFENNALTRVQMPEGFITAADTTLHLYITDHQGNIAGVYNTRTDSLEQRTGYYPYGLPHASASENGGPETNRHKFGTKELTADLGLNLYDFAARWHNPALPGFTTPDPLAESNISISIYCFCSADPINRIDPTGLADFYNKDKYLGSDGINDGKRFVLNTTQKSYNSSGADQVPGAGLPEETATESIDFVTNNNGNQDAFKNNPDIYNNFTEIESRQNVLNGIAAIGSIDNGKGGSRKENNQEHGGHIANGAFIKEESGKVRSPDSNDYANISLYDGEGKVHTHPSGTKTVNIPIYDNPNIPRSLQPKPTRWTTNDYKYIQHPSSTDIKNAGQNTNYVIGMTDRVVYIYDS